MIRALRFPLLRMLRSYLGLILLLVLPLCLISVLGLISSHVPGEGGGEAISGMTWLSVSFMISFQLFGGSYTMAYMKEDFFTPRKWRMYSLPIKPVTYAFTILVASVLFNAAQGMVIVFFTKLVYGVNWGNLGWVLLIIIVVSVLSQLVCLIFVLSVKNYKIAERLSEVYGIGSIILAGMMFSLPKSGFFDFMSTYGNPVSLGQNAIFGMISGEGMDLAFLSLGILLIATLLVAFGAIFVGRRKLA